MANTDELRDDKVQLRHDVLFSLSIPVFPGLPGRRERILSLEIMSRD